ncbi:UNVERIFIED_CONTAM: hypothetical protein GTU68_022579 [Idotea baltica]|nr:hypothetical protein [Idotea baltica]
MPNEVLCLAGESGSGKSMTAMAIMGLLPKPAARITRGQILLGEQDLAHMSENDFRQVRATRVAMIFQEPMTSLNPVMTIGEQITEILTTHSKMSASKASSAALTLLEEVRLTEPERRMRQYPHELSGGMRQRVVIAMALADQPDVLIADEPTTALDVTVQAQVLDLLRELREEEGLSYLFISHDMAVVEQVSDRVVVLFAGQVVESGPVSTVLHNPAHPYTQRLLSAVPIPDPTQRRKPLLTAAEEPASVMFPMGTGPTKQLLREHAPGHLVADGY